jgi:hypothetical protein
VVQGLGFRVRISVRVYAVQKPHDATLTSGPHLGAVHWREIRLIAMEAGSTLAMVPGSWGWERQHFLGTSQRSAQECRQSIGRVEHAQDTMC